MNRHRFQQRNSGDGNEMGNQQRETPTPKTGTIAHRITWVLCLGFHIVIVGAILRGYLPITFEIHTGLLKSLLSGSNRGYLIPAAELEPFKRLLAPTDRVSFIMNHPGVSDPEEEKFFLDARNYLAPVILDAGPREPGAIVYCTSEQTANERLTQTGYRWILKLSPGKGLAAKLQ